MEATFLLTLLITFLASFIGYELISKIPQTLHTPLMSGSNAISGITLIAAILIYPEVGESQILKIIVLIAIAFATLNIVCLLYTSPSPRDATLSRMPSSA